MIDLIVKGQENPPKSEHRLETNIKKVKNK